MKTCKTCKTCHGEVLLDGKAPTRITEPAELAAQSLEDAYDKGYRDGESSVKFDAVAAAERSAEHAKGYAAGVDAAAKELESRLSITDQSVKWAIQEAIKLIRALET